MSFTPNNVTMLQAMQGIIPVEQGQPIVKEVMANSLVMQLANYEAMTATKKEFDVFLNGIGAYWVGEGERIQTSSPTWTKVAMEAKKLGVIIPVSREFLNYKQADFFNFMKPYIAEAFYKKFDQAALLDVDNPFNWAVLKSVDDKLIEGDLDLENFDKAVDGLNEEGYEPNAIVSKVQNNTILRGLVRDDNGLLTRLYDGKSLDGVPVFDLHRDITDFTKGSLILGDFDQAYYGIPYNMNYAISTDATLTTIEDEDGNPVNLFEREMVAMRVTMDVAFMIIKDEAFAAIAPATPVTP